MIRRYCFKVDKATQTESFEILQLNGQLTFSCESNDYVDQSNYETRQKLPNNNPNTEVFLYPSPSPSSSSASASSLTCLSVTQVKTGCQQSTRDRLRATIAKRTREKLAKTKGKPSEPLKEKLSQIVLKKSTFDRLIEDNFIMISIQDEKLCLGSAMRQFEQNKFNELILFTSLFDEKVTLSKQNLKAHLLIGDLAKHTEQWINTMKHISSFKNIGINDQMLCIKRHFVHLNVIKGLIAIDPGTKTLQRNGFKINMEKCPIMNNPRFLQMLSSMHNVFRSDPIINALLVLIHLFDANVPNLASTFTVRKEYIITIHLLQKYLELRGLTNEQAHSEISKFLNESNSFSSSFNAKLHDQ